jgi:protein phosphatase
VFASAIDQGLRRSSNQDQALAMRLPDGAVLLAVADGVGGAAGGDVAAALAIEELAAAFSRGPGADPADLLLHAFDRANARVLQVGAEVSQLEGLATTLVAAIITGETAHVANAGDSRAYIFHEGLLEQITNDHTWTAERVRSGQMTEDEAATSPFRHTITRGIGVAHDLGPDLLPPVSLPPGATVLLCSDGLYGPASAAEIAEALNAAPAEDAPARLITLANNNGGPDNIAVALYTAA